MTYLSRLAAQTGLIDAPEPHLSPSGIEVIDDVVEAPRAPRPAADSGNPTPAAPVPAPSERGHEEIVERVVLEPAPPASRPRPAPPPDRPATSSAAPERTPECHEAMEPVEPPAPPPGDPRELRIRQVLEWVAQNDDRSGAPQTSAPGSPASQPTPTPEPATAHAAMPSFIEPPAQEIAAPVPAPVAKPERRTVAPVRRPAPPEPVEPQPRIAPSKHEVGIMEERIDISIGTIRLDVKPPAAPAAVRAAAPPPAPTPRPLGGSSPSSRLRRRYIRI